MMTLTAGSRETMEALEDIRAGRQDPLRCPRTPTARLDLGASVSQVERGHRNVTIGELLALCIVLHVTMGELLDPQGVDGEHEEELQIGDTTMWVRDAHDWLRSSKRINLLPSNDGRRQ